MASTFGTRTFIKSKIQALNLGGRKFDTVLCSHILEHIPNISQTLRWIHDEVLTEDGVLIVAFPNVDAIRHEGWRYDGEGLLPHRHFFNAWTGEVTLEAQGFDVIDFKCNFPGYNKPAWFIKVFGQLFNSIPWLRTHWADCWYVCKKKEEN